MVKGVIPCALGASAFASLPDGLQALGGGDFPSFCEDIWESGIPLVVGHAERGTELRPVCGFDSGNDNLLLVMVGGLTVANSATIIADAPFPIMAVVLQAPEQVIDYLGILTDLFGLIFFLVGFIISCRRSECHCRPMLYPLRGRCEGYPPATLEVIAFMVVGNHMLDHPAERPRRDQLSACKEDGAMISGWIVEHFVDEIIAANLELLCREAVSEQFGVRYSHQLVLYGAELMFPKCRAIKDHHLSKSLNVIERWELRLEVRALLSTQPTEDLLGALMEQERSLRLDP